MSKVRRLKPYERHILRKLGYIPKYFLFLSRDADGYEFLEVTSGKILEVRY